MHLYPHYLCISSVLTAILDSACPLSTKTCVQLANEVLHKPTQYAAAEHCTHNALRHHSEPALVYVVSDFAAECKSFAPVSLIAIVHEGRQTCMVCTPDRHDASHTGHSDN